MNERRRRAGLDWSQDYGAFLDGKSECIRQHVDIMEQKSCDERMYYL